MTIIKINAVVENNGQYLLVKRSLEDGGYWQTITGGVEADENLIPAVRREVREETGITRLTIDEPPIHFFTWERSGNDIVEVAYLCHTAERDVILSQEHTDYVWASPDEAVTIVEKPNNKVVVQKAHERQG